jgi:hypothetical protein
LFFNNVSVAIDITNKDTINTKEITIAPQFKDIIDKGKKKNIANGGRKKQSNSST